MKKFLSLFLIFFVFLASAQKEISKETFTISLVKFKVVKKSYNDNGKITTYNEVTVIVPSHKGKIEVNYYNEDKTFYSGGVYTNMKGFSETGTLPSGKYTIDIIKYSDEKIDRLRTDFIIK